MKTFKDIIAEVAEPKPEDEKRFKAKHVVAKTDHPTAEEDQFTAKKMKKKKNDASHEAGEDEEVYESYISSSYNKKKMSEEEMTDAQMKKREEIVKSMKDQMPEFKKRYGDKAKAVMYATATKMAMKNEEVDLEEAKRGRSTMSRLKDIQKDAENFKPKKKNEEVECNCDCGESPCVECGKDHHNIQEAVIDDLRSIVKNKSMKEVKFADGSKTKVDMTTASALVSVHDQLNSQNKKKFADAINKDQRMFMKMMDFAFSAGKK